MSDWMGVSGWTISLLSLLGVNLFQGINSWINRRLRQRDDHDRVAMKNAMVQLRSMLTAACENPEAASTEKMKQFIRHTGHQVLTPEHFVDAMLRAHGVAVGQP
jgi:hypothetical protein